MNESNESLILRLVKTQREERGTCFCFISWAAALFSVIFAKRRGWSHIFLAYYCLCPYVTKHTGGGNYSGGYQARGVQFKTSMENIRNFDMQQPCFPGGPRSSGQQVGRAWAVKAPRCTPITWARERTTTESLVVFSAVCCYTLYSIKRLSPRIDVLNLGVEDLAQAVSPYLTNPFSTNSLICIQNRYGVPRRLHSRLGLCAPYRGRRSQSST